MEIILILISVSVLCGVIFGILFEKDYKSGKLDNFEHPEI